MDTHWDPHACTGCGALFEVGYEADPDADGWILADVVCPRCGKRKSVPVVAGAETTLRIELDDEDSPFDEGGGS